MKKEMGVAAAIAITIFGWYTVLTLYAAGMENGLMKSSEVSSLMGREVKNAQGENLGRIKDFVVDPEGRIEFALLSTGGVLGIGGKIIPVPFEALSYQGEGRDAHFALDMSKEQLAKAPEYKVTVLVDRTWGEKVYRFFGLEPRWSERGMTGEQQNTPPEAGPQSKEGIGNQTTQPGGSTY